MKRVICVMVLVLCSGCATSGKFEAVPIDLDLRSDERVAIEEGARKPAAGGLAAVPVVGAVIELLKGKPGRLTACLCRIEWGVCPRCGEEVAADE